VCWPRTTVYESDWNGILAQTLCSPIQCVRETGLVSSWPEQPLEWDLGPDSKNIYIKIKYINNRIQSINKGVDGKQPQWLEECVESTTG